MPFTSYKYKNILLVFFLVHIFFYAFMRYIYHFTPSIYHLFTHKRVILCIFFQPLKIIQSSFWKKYNFLLLQKENFHTHLLLVTTRVSTNFKHDFVSFMWLMYFFLLTVTIWLSTMSIIISLYLFIG